jgi:CRP/FNR family cyclic AMP-dependent transcriptional regulator
LDKVAAKTRTVEHASGKEIASQGQSGLGFHLLISGTADVLVNGTVARHMEAGDYFGEISLIDGKPRSATVVTTSPATTLSLAAWDFTPLLDEEPELTKALLLATCKRLRDAEAR